MSAELYERLPFPVADAMVEAMREAMRKHARGLDLEPDYTEQKYAAAWEWLNGYRGAGKTSAYGPIVQAINDDANSHAFRGFLVGWAMAMAYRDATEKAPA